MLPFDWCACALTHTSTVSQICSITHAPHADALLLPIRVFKITPRSSQQRAERSANAQQTESRELAKHSKTPTEVRAARTGPPGEGRRTTAPSQAAPHAALSPAAANGRAARPGQVSGRGLRRAGGRAAAGLREGLGPGSAPPPPLVPAPLPRASPGSGSLALHTGEGTETGAARTNRRGPARWRSGSASGLTHAAPPRASSRRLRRPARKDG